MASVDHSGQGDNEPGLSPHLGSQLSRWPQSECSTKLGNVAAQPSASPKATPITLHGTELGVLHVTDLGSSQTQTTGLGIPAPRSLGLLGETLRRKDTRGFPEWKAWVAYLSSSPDCLLLTCYTEHC